MDKAEIILYADDTTIYYAHEDPKMIQETLGNQCNNINNWLGDNIQLLDETEQNIVIYQWRADQLFADAEGRGK